MNRRDFIKTSSIGLSLPFWLQGCDLFPGSTFPIHIHSDQHVGHLVKKSNDWPQAPAIETEVAIVGGGIAGLTSAFALRKKDFCLFELSDRLGGTSSAHRHQGVTFAQGAHYELAYPDNYGEEVLQLLEGLKVVQYEGWKSLWTFTDRQHIIPHSRRQQCYENGKWRGDVITDRFQKGIFYGIMQEYAGEMRLPTRLIRDDLKYLDKISFHQFLSQKMEVNEAFKRQLSYHMLDDYGGDINTVSALAGIHYFMCRPYLTRDVDLFSPPQGNSYFSNKLIDHLPKERLKTKHLIKQIRKAGDGFEMTVLDTSSRQAVEVLSNQVIFAGNKHALKFICPEEAHLFDNNYAPWMVINFIVEGKPGEFGYWQNEYLGERNDFLGFVDSSVQSNGMHGKRVLTAYYCLKPESRNYLTTVPEYKHQIAHETLRMIEEVLQKRLKVEAAFINVMGHAMPIPKPGYLFNDANERTTMNITYAGVDNGRLPLLFEALDSGLMAANKLI